MRSSLLVRDHDRFVVRPATDSFFVDRYFDKLVDTFVWRDIESVLLSDSWAQESR